MVEREQKEDRAKYERDRNGNGLWNLMKKLDN